MNIHGSDRNTEVKMDNNTTSQATAQQETKFCKECGQKIAKKCVICPHCGCQVENLEGTQPTQQQPQIVINNSNLNQNTNQNQMGGIRPKNKWVALLLCFFLGVLGAHKFYEGKVGMGIVYILTIGIFGIGVIVDFITLLFKPNPYYV